MSEFPKVHLIWHSYNTKKCCNFPQIQAKLQEKQSTPKTKFPFGLKTISYWLLMTYARAEKIGWYWSTQYWKKKWERNRAFLVKYTSLLLYEKCFSDVFIHKQGFLGIFSYSFVLFKIWQKMWRERFLLAICLHLGKEFLWKLGFIKGFCCISRSWVLEIFYCESQQNF